MTDVDDVVSAILDDLVKRIVAKEKARLKLRDRTLPYRTPAARRAGNQSWYCRNTDYERGRCLLKWQWYRGDITREEYLAKKEDLYARTHQGYADEVIRRRSFGARARELSTHG
jgi:hypothetical protein